MKDFCEKIWERYEDVRLYGGLIHCISNTITINDCANILLAAGASPTMAHHPAEVSEITAAAAAFVGNLGATENYDAMEISVKTAKEHGIPSVIDPVGCGGSTFRRDYFSRLSRIGLTCVRGNYSEIRALSQHRATAAGVDAHDGGQDIERIAASFASGLGAVVAASGAVDILTDGKRLFRIHNGSRWMSRITGSGCMLSCLVGAFLGREAKRPDRDDLLAVTAACVAMNLCGEIGAERTEALLQASGGTEGGTMTFHREMLDAVSRLRAEDFQTRTKVERVF